MPRSKSRKPKSIPVIDLNVVEKAPIGSLKADSNYDLLTTSQRLALRLLDSAPRQDASKLPLTEWPDLAATFRRWADEILRGEYKDSSNWSQSRRDKIVMLAREWARQVDFVLEILQPTSPSQIQPQQFIN